MLSAGPPEKPMELDIATAGPVTIGPPENIIMPNASAVPAKSIDPDIVLPENLSIITDLNPKQVKLNATMAITQNLPSPALLSKPIGPAPSSTAPLQETAVSYAEPLPSLTNMDHETTISPQEPATTQPSIHHEGQLNKFNFDKSWVLQLTKAQEGEDQSDSPRSPTPRVDMQRKLDKAKRQRNRNAGDVSYFFFNN
jgi:hypothetical protein